MKEWLKKLLDEKRKEEFYGKVVLQFKKGEIIYVREEKTVIPPVRLE